MIGLVEDMSCQRSLVEDNVIDGLHCRLVISNIFGFLWYTDIRKVGDLIDLLDLLNFLDLSI